MCVRVYLDLENLRYKVLPYGEPYTASCLAWELHLAGKELAKVVILKVVDRFMKTLVLARGCPGYHERQHLRHTPR